MSWKTRLVLYVILWMSYGALCSLAVLTLNGIEGISEALMTVAIGPVYYFTFLWSTAWHSNDGLLLSLIILSFIILHAWVWFRCKKNAQLVLLVGAHFLIMVFSIAGVLALFGYK